MRWTQGPEVAPVAMVGGERRGVSQEKARN